MSVKEIEIAIAQLPSADLVELMAWLENYHAEMWDKQIEEDLEAGRLDALLAEVDKEYDAELGLGPTRSRFRKAYQQDDSSSCEGSCARLRSTRINAAQGCVFLIFPSSATSILNSLGAFFAPKYNKNTINEGEFYNDNNRQHH